MVVGSEIQTIKLFLDTTKQYNSGLVNSQAKDISKIDIQGKLKERHDLYLKKKQLEDEAKAKNELESHKDRDRFEESKNIREDESSLSTQIDEVDLILQKSEDFKRID